MFNAISKLKRKTVKLLYWIITIILLASFMASAYFYTNNTCGSALWIGTAIILVWPIMTFVFVTVVWSWKIQDLMTDYKQNNNILSGGFALMLLFAFMFITFLFFSGIEEHTVMKEIFEGFSKLVIAAMPAFIGLLGVQYSVAIQEKNRKEDLRMGAKPFFAIKCEVAEIIPLANGHTSQEICVVISMKNISQNIGIPQKIISLDDALCEIPLKYCPMAPTDEFCDSFVISSQTPYVNKAKIAVYYTDTYNNLYKMNVEFFLYDNAKLSETRIICDELTWVDCNE